MKILILSIYSNIPLYKQMLELQRKYIHSNPNVTSYFIQFRSQTQPIEIVNDFIYIRGIETRMKITEKTLLSLKYLLETKGLEFDFIIRTNISTIINFTQLFTYLDSIPKLNIYCTGHLLNLQWTDHTSGITNKKLFGTLFAAGTSIILSPDVANFMIKNIDKFRHDIIDDVAIGIFMKDYLPDVLTNLKNFKASYLITNPNIKINDSINYVFIRNRINNHENKRNQDLINMRAIIKLFQ
jgi:hypothetical protein